MRSSSFLLNVSLAAALLASLQTQAQNYDLKVESGALDRPETVASFFVPETSQSWGLYDADGRRVPLQVDYLGRASFLVTDLKAGDSRSLALKPETSPAVGQPAVRVEDADGGLNFSIGRDLVLRYQAEKSEPPRPGIDPLFRRGGYLHPIKTPSGVVITDDYPSNHIHHHGVWFPWTHTRFEGRQPDFWNMGAGSGRVEFVSLGEKWSGSVHGGFTSRHRFTDLTAPGAPKVALDEVWDVRVYNLGAKSSQPYRVFDLRSVQQCATDAPLILPEYRYGGLGFRGHWDWNGPENTFYLTSEGISDRVKGHATRARWCHIGGKTDGQLAGAAIFCHPDNFRFPQPMRIHPTEPFFNYAPSQAGDFSIEPGKPYVSEYRFIVQDGEPNPELLNQLWEDYANPVAVTLTKK